MKKTIYICLISLVFCAFASAKPSFTISPKIEEAYQHCISFELEKAAQVLDEISYEESNNLLRHHIANYIDFFRIFINEEKEDFERSYPLKSKRLKAIRSGDKSSPYYRFSQAEILLQWALVELKFDEYLTAILDIKKAYDLLEENHELFPSFIANKKSLGALHAVLSTVPPQFKKGFEWISGMQGSIELGRQELEEVLDYADRNTFLFEKETKVIYAYVLLHLMNEPQKAWDYINNTEIANEHHPMAQFIMANIAMRSHHNQKALEILEARAKILSDQTFHFLDLMHGIALLNNLDPNAEFYLNKFNRNYKGQNFRKEVYQKLAWHALIFENEIRYNEFMKQCLSHGKRQIDEDKSAHMEAEKGIAPNPILLKGRLLFDGGYYNKAIELLIEHSFTLNKQKDTHNEFNYRMGRINQAMGHDYVALSYYKSCIEVNEKNKGHWSCNAALQSALIAEKQGYPDVAEKYFRQCLSIKSELYANSLHQKAKAGLNRIKGR